MPFKKNSIPWNKGKHIKLKHKKNNTPGFPQKRICKTCKKEFNAHNPLHIYCGNRKKKYGCAYKRQLEWGRSEHRRKYDRERKKAQRQLNTEYAKKQRILNRKYYKKNKNQLKKLSKEWRKKNIKRILFLNKKRMKRIKKIKGSHTYKEWENLKRKYNYRCALCRISKKELENKWKGTQFKELTEDHIVPISKGGTDFINNIQPLCISCNAKKRDKI